MNRFRAPLPKLWQALPKKTAPDEMVLPFCDPMKRFFTHLAEILHTWISMKRICLCMTFFCNVSCKKCYLQISLFFIFLSIIAVLEITNKLETQLNGNLLVIICDYTFIEFAFSCFEGGFITLSRYLNRK